MVDIVQQVFTSKLKAKYMYTNPAQLCTMEKCTFMVALRLPLQTVRQPKFPTVWSIKQELYHLTLWLVRVLLLGTKSTYALTIMETNEHVIRLITRWVLLPKYKNRFILTDESKLLQVTVRLISFQNGKLTPTPQFGGYTPLPSL